MSVLTVRGGVPRIVAAAIDATGRRVNLPFYTNHIQIKTDAAVKLYFTPEDWTADANYLSLVAPATGFVLSWEGPAELDAIWLKGAANVTVIAYQRRG
jgi:hypothetical protein